MVKSHTKWSYHTRNGHLTYEMVISQMKWPFHTRNRHLTHELVVSNTKWSTCEVLHGGLSWGPHGRSLKFLGFYLNFDNECKQLLQCQELTRTLAQSGWYNKGTPAGRELLKKQKIRSPKGHRQGMSKQGGCFMRTTKSHKYSARSGWESCPVRCRKCVLQNNSPHICCKVR